MSDKSRNHLIRFLACLLLCSSSVSAQTKPPAHAAYAGQVLSLIEKYKAPPYPRDQYLDRETYEYRISSHRPVPETLTDVFICDVWQRVDMELKSKVSPQDVSEDIIKQALNVYLEKKYEDIAGYRPWTHWNFIRGLKQSQRDVLAQEVTDYIKKNGVRDRDERTEQKK
jgi:hypothetical protein